jgi:hypothetical protein
MRMPLDEISKAMVVRRHQQMSGSPSAANHVLRGFRAIYNHARRTWDLPESPTMAIEWFEDKPDGRIIENLKHWRKTIDDLPNPIHRVFYELLLFTGLRKPAASNCSASQNRAVISASENAGRTTPLPTPDAPKPLSACKSDKKRALLIFIAKDPFYLSTNISHVE